MKALITEDLYDRFLECRLGMIRDGIGNPAQVFVPVGALPTEAPPRMPRILYVGKATRNYGEDELTGYQESAAGAAEAVRRYLPSGRWAFWQFGRDMLFRVAEGCGVSAQEGEPLAYFGWSNLAKIGDQSDNPGDASLDHQKALCIESLKAEIATFRPDAIVLVNTNYAEKEILLPIFGEGDWSYDTPKGDRVAFKPYGGSLVVWTNHPHGMRLARTFAGAQDYAVDLILRKWRGRPLPQCEHAASLPPP